MLLAPVVFDCKALAPIPVLLLAVVLASKAPSPKAVLKDPVVLNANDNLPHYMRN